MRRATDQRSEVSLGVQRHVLDRVIVGGRTVTAHEGAVPRIFGVSEEVVRACGVRRPDRLTGWCHERRGLIPSMSGEDSLMTDDQERFPLWTPPQPIKLPGTGAIDYCVANDGSQRPKGTRRRSQRDSRYVTTCQEGALGQVDWIESRSPAVTTTVRSPQSGTLDSKGDNGNISSVGAVLTVEVSWGQEFQEATVRYDAECWFWDAVMWHREEKACPRSSNRSSTGRSPSART